MKKLLFTLSLLAVTVSLSFAQAWTGGREAAHKIFIGSGNGAPNLIDTGASKQVLISQGNSDAVWVSLIKTSTLAADTILSATTPTNSPLSFDIAASQSFTCTAKLYCTCDSVQGIKFAITVPTSGTLKGEAIGQTTSVTATKYDPISTSGTATAAYLTAAASNGYVELQFTVKNSTTAGTVRIQFESIAGGGNVAIKANSTLTATLLSN